MKIVTIGETGLIKSKLVALLAGQGHEVLVAAPNTGVDTLAGEGFDRALEGAEVVVDVSSSPSFDDKPAMDFFQTVSRNIDAAEKTPEVRGASHALMVSHPAEVAAPIKGAAASK
jgi:uncharacterized protein YbjT (DUF2867 family)